MFKLLTAIVALSASTAFALPVGVSRPIEKLQIQKGLKGFNAQFDFEGIVKLNNCSGALIQLQGQSEDKKAVIMTNGHCADLPGGVFIKPNEVLVNRPVRRQIGIFDSRMKLNRVNTTKFIYATMTGTDLALYELELTYRQIKDRFDIDPYLLAPVRPRANTEMQVISGYWERGWDCRIESFVNMIKEDAYVWTDSIKYDANCNTTHGSSGSPIIERNTRVVIGVNNTGNDSGERCTMNNPCEVSANGSITAIKGRSYGQQTYQVYSCLNTRMELDLGRPGCKLLKPQALRR